MLVRLEGTSVFLRREQPESLGRALPLLKAAPSSRPLPFDGSNSAPSLGCYHWPFLCLVLFVSRGRASFPPLLCVKVCLCTRVLLLQNEGVEPVFLFLTVPFFLFLFLLFFIFSMFRLFFSPFFSSLFSLFLSVSSLLLSLLFLFLLSFPLSSPFFPSLSLYLSIAPSLSLSLSLPFSFLRIHTYKAVFCFLSPSTSSGL